MRQEAEGEFLYVCGYQQVKSFAKLTLTGEIVWFRKAPMEAGGYAPGEDLSTTRNWTRQGFLPTNFAFLDDGGFLLTDGYGSYRIHRFDKHAKWLGCFGGAGGGRGTFNTPHGLWLDGQFVHPHDACFSPTGDIFVAEWVPTGRVTKLEKIA